MAVTYNYFNLALLTILMGTTFKLLIIQKNLTLNQTDNLYFISWNNLKLSNYDLTKN